MTAGPHVRDMTAADCEAVAAARVTGWRTAYRGLVPQTYLDALSVERDAERRREQLARGDGSVVHLVAERAGEVIGWGCGGPYREESGARTADGEVYALYVRPDHWSTGAGRLLLAGLTARVAAQGHPRLLLWVLKANDRARRFYERAGFAPDGAEEDFVADGIAVPEVRYVRRLTEGGAR
ncbi:GNAT family N-acetyltransferase [Streptomyces sp. NPDC051597]|uniref:GNAT family N-acetyltransferase n=1 Tax=Streptomyces sp. NPDC051597 TaxID=3155049 RepID=UPI00341FFE8B